LFDETVIGGFVMKSRRDLCATALLAGLLPLACSAGEIGDYLTKDGKLKEVATVKTGAVSFLAPPGKLWTIEPSGDWTEKFSDAKGKLSTKQLAALAQHLATQEFNSLPAMQGYDSKGSDGYEYVVIAFGKKVAAFNTKIGETQADYLPKPGDPKGPAWSRFIALELALTDLLQKSERTMKQRK
jgi:hypothetical protein